jgi:hypothetical protein
VKQLVTRGNALLARREPDPDGVHELIDGIAGLPPRELARFDERSRSWVSGFAASHIVVLRGEAGLALRDVLGMVAHDGHERERAIRSAPPTPLSMRLIAIRCVDWVPQVREAARSRLEQSPSELLLQALPLVDQLARERVRGQDLEALLEARLSDDDLRRAFVDEDLHLRRAAWERLAARGSATPDELLRVAATDGDVLVRAVAVHALPDLPDRHRRELAERLVEDRVGWIAVQVLAVLVELDGAEAIVPALTARTAALRRAARDWASVKDVEARAIYLERLAARRDDAIALVALAEIADARDRDRFLAMLDDPRTPVQAAGLRALARVDHPAGRRAAIEALDGGATGRVTWAAAQVLRDGSPTRAEQEVLARVALDLTRSAGQRFRALSMLRQARWLHLAVLLEAHAQEPQEDARRRLWGEIKGWSGARVARAPSDELRARIERFLPAVDAGKRDWIEFVLRTSS